MKVMTVAVAGGTDSGKTALVQALIEGIKRERAAFVPHSAYCRDLSHLPVEEQSRANSEHPDSLEREALTDQHLGVQSGESGGGR